MLYRTCNCIIINLHLQLATLKYFKKSSSWNLLFCDKKKLHLRTTICSGWRDKGRNTRTEIKVWEV